MFRASLAELLERDPRVEVVGQAGTGLEAVKVASQLKPDVVVMDLKLPGVSGVEATRRIVSQHPEIRVLMLTGFDSDSLVLDALQAGVSGFLLKDAPPEALITSILAVMADEHVIASHVAKRLFGILTKTHPARELYQGLTAREVEILRLIAVGIPNKQIAHRLQLSDKTVRNAVSSIYEKLNVPDRSQAALYAVRKGLIEL